MSTAVRAAHEAALIHAHTAPELSGEIEEWADRHGHDLGEFTADEIAELYLDWCENEYQARAEAEAEARWEERRYDERYG